MEFMYEKHEQDWHMIREEVFMKEQGFQQEFDDLDHQSIHIVVYDQGKPMGCGRVYEDSTDSHVWHLGRLAVLKEYRNRHLGAGLIHQLEQQAQRHGAITMVLSAQVQAIPFYEKCGYQAFGEQYMDEHVPHQTMKKTL